MLDRSGSIYLASQEAAYLLDRSGSVCLASQEVALCCLSEYHLLVVHSQTV